MKDRITGQDLLECAVNCMKKSGSWNKMASITTELEKIGIVKLLKNKLQTQDVDMISCLFIAFCIRRAFIKLHWT